MVPKKEWKPFRLSTQLEPQNGWTGWRNHVNYDVFAQASCLEKEQGSLGQNIEA